MNKTKIRKLRQANKIKNQQKIKSDKLQTETKLWLVQRKKDRKSATPERAKQFFDGYFSSLTDYRNENNSEIPSLITDKWGKCTKKKSPLDY